MKIKPIGLFALLTLLTSIVWLVLMIGGIITAGSLETFEDIITYIGRLDGWHYATYINASLLTLLNMVLFAALYQRYQSAAPLAALVGFMFIPVYGALNLVVYLSQVTVVPGLVQMYQIVELRAAAEQGLRLLVQLWSGSFIAFINVMAYALLGISSIIFATIINQEEPELRRLRLGVFLLELNGVACIVGLIGVIADHTMLMNGMALGGALFIGALVPLAVYFLKN